MNKIRALAVSGALVGIAACAAAPSDRTSAVSPPPAQTEAKAAAAASAAGAAPAYDALLSNYPYPFPVAHYEISAQKQSLRMAYMDVPPQGTVSNGRTVLLLHGKNFSGAYWAPTIRALTERGYRVVAPDQVGFGKSSKPEHFHYSLHVMANMTRGLLDHLGVDRVAVVGHSMGGMLATRFTLAYPEQTEQLVLVNPIGLEDWQRYVPYRSVTKWYKTLLQSQPDGVRQYMQQAYFRGEWKPEYDALVDIQAGWIRGPDYARIAWISALTYDMVFTQPVLYEFPDIRAPTLLIIGLNDRTALGRNWASQDNAAKLGNYEQLGKRTAEQIANAQLVEIEGVGHLPQVEAFDTYITAVTEFLAAGSAAK